MVASAWTADDEGDEELGEAAGDIRLDRAASRWITKKKGVPTSPAHAAEERFCCMAVKRRR